MTWSDDLWRFACGDVWNWNTLSHIYGVGTSDIDEIDTALGNCKCQRRLSSGWFLSIAITCWVPPGVTPVVLQHNPETFDERLILGQGAGLQRIAGLIIIHTSGKLSQPSRVGWSSYHLIISKPSADQETESQQWIRLRLPLERKVYLLNTRRSQTTLER